HLEPDLRLAGRASLRPSARAAAAASEPDLRPQRPFGTIEPMARCDGERDLAQSARWHGAGRRTLARERVFVPRRSRRGRPARTLPLPAFERDRSRHGRDPYSASRPSGLAVFRPWNYFGPPLYRQSRDGGADVPVPLFR